ncbi:hypothetical protein H6P81_016757 [Aristolochia fimbriata]|uniref:Uncharacterized protein n=1 Tax=Aristolochia fimbriata TaxID=158543 RepID=A0AAV7E984_ARIFI|nr:hypothetical protein H6P81_016757 [Aristolochia fimbriata]
MKRHWCAERATRAYVETVKAVKPRGFPTNASSELVAAMAAGSGARVILEAWAAGDGMGTTVALSIAGRHTGARHVCLVPDERAREEYEAGARTAGAGETAEVVVGEAEEVMASLPEVDFVVVDCRRKDFAKVLRFAKIGSRGAFLVGKNAGQRGFRWRGVVGSGTRIVRSAFLPAGKGMEIAQVVAGGGLAGHASGKSRWIKHVDHCTGEEHVFRR